MKTALNGAVVLDLTRLTPGAFGTLLLADLGADVIKVEQPGSGDYLRTLVPAAFEALCRDKRSVTVDLRASRGRELFMELVKGADVVVESFRPGVCERLGIGFDQLRVSRADVIMCSLSGYGQSGPNRDLSGHDLNYLGVAGALSLMGTPDGPPAHATGIAVADFNAATVMALSIVAAVMERDRTGVGQWIDVSMTDAMAAWMGRYVLEFQQSGTRRSMMRRPGYSVYRTASGGSLTLGCIEDKFWTNLLTVIPVDHELHTFAASSAREADIEKVEQLLADLISQRPRAEWLEIFRRADVPAGPVNVFDDVFDDAQLRARGMVVQGDDGPRAHVGLCSVMAAGPKPAVTAPTLGEHNADVWAALGADVADLERAGVI